MASLDDILSAVQNAVRAINAWSTASNFHAGQVQSTEISVSTTLKTTSGWVANVSVIVAGSTVGYIYDTNNASATTGKRVYTIPNTVGVYQVNIPIGMGIVVVPGTSQVVAIGYS